MSQQDVKTYLEIYRNREQRGTAVRNDWAKLDYLWSSMTEAEKHEVERQLAIGVG